MPAVMRCPWRCWFSVSIFNAQGYGTTGTLYQSAQIRGQSGHLKEPQNSKYMTNLPYYKCNSCIHLSLVVGQVWRLYCLLKYAVFRHIMLCCPVKVHSKYAALFLYSEDGDSRFLWNISTVLLCYTLSCPRRQHFSWWLQWDLQISHILCAMQYRQLNI